MSKPFSPACERNRAPILAILRALLTEPGRVLEIGSGTGQHAVYFGERMPHLIWQTSDQTFNHPGILAWMEEAALPNVLPPLALDVMTNPWPQGPFDAVFSANTSHIMSWEAVQAMFAGIGQVLRPGGIVAIYGPFNQDGKFTSDSNAAFDASLKAQDPRMGIRDLEAMQSLAAQQDLMLIANHAMPANNQLLVWRRRTAD